MLLFLVFGYGARRCRDVPRLAALVPRLAAQGGAGAPDHGNRSRCAYRDSLRGLRRRALRVSPVVDRRPFGYHLVPRPQPLPHPRPKPHPVAFVAFAAAVPATQPAAQDARAAAAYRFPKNMEAVAVGAAVAAAAAGDGHRSPTPWWERRPQGWPPFPRSACCCPRRTCIAGHTRPGSRQRLPH